MTAGDLEDLVEVALALPDPHVEDLVETNGHEVGSQFAGERAGNEGLATARRAVEQQPAA